MDRAGELAKELGAKRCMPLKVSGPFHTKLMKPAGDALAQHFQSHSLRGNGSAGVLQLQGAPMGKGHHPRPVGKQVQSSVYWEDTIRAMEADGIDTIVEIGPGKTLSSFVKKTGPPQSVPLPLTLPPTWRR